MSQAERPILTFCAVGLSPREDLLLKAFVRLLDHLTHQKWSCLPPEANVRFDLLVVADGFEPTYGQAPGQQPQLVLRVGSTNIEGPGYLTWPLKPNALEDELNRLGGLALRPPGLQPVSGELQAAPVSTASTPTVAQQLMRLQQWPPARLLAGPGRMRLATLLTGKSISLAELVSRSALPLPLCKAFIDDLQVAKLLVSNSIAPQRTAQSLVAQPTSLPPKAVQPGLLDRIRLRLGIKSNR